MKSITLASAIILNLALAGCGHSEIDTVKAAIVPQDSTHTYGTALSHRDSCEKDSWRTVPGQRPPATESVAVSKAIDVAQPSGKGQDCYDAKLKDFRNGIGEEGPVSNDMMHEWRSQCGLSPA